MFALKCHLRSSTGRYLVSAGAAVDQAKSRIAGTVAERTAYS